MSARLCTFRDVTAAAESGGLGEAPQLDLGLMFDRRVEIVRSARRRHTISAEERDGVVRVLMPAGMTEDEESHWVAEMLGRLDRRRRRVPRNDEDLFARAAALARRYRLPEPASIRWAGNQRSRWGSCTIDDRTVRLSTALVECPPWVVDYVIVHELAHLIEPGHGRRFWEIVNRYPRAERARGFLMAKELDAAS